MPTPIDQDQQASVIHSLSWTGKLLSSGAWEVYRAKLQDIAEGYARIALSEQTTYENRTAAVAKFNAVTELIPLVETIHENARKIIEKAEAERKDKEAGGTANNVWKV